MTESDTPIQTVPARSVHRLTVLVVCLVWPLIWVGGLVTTNDAGMAVPDWPNTYGYNLFLYPYDTWFFGPFDLFIEHGHRLLGAVVGFVVMGIVFSAVRDEPRRWVIGFSIAVLAAVIFQGVLGGIRVVQASRTIAMLHGCFGPAFFAACVALAVVTSRRWWSAHEKVDANSIQITRSMVFMGLALVATSYLQLVLGAQLRHIQPAASPSGFVLKVAFHVMTAFFLWGLVAAAWLRLRRCGDLTLSRPAFWLIGLMGIQIVLGVGSC